LPLLKPFSEEELIGSKLELTPEKPSSFLSLLEEHERTKQPTAITNKIVF
jgi:hypothetical protein